MSDPFRLHDSLGYRLSLAARLQQRGMEEALKPFGLSRTLWAILTVIGSENLNQPSDIADHVGIDRTATSRALRRMEADGLIARSANGTDGRARHVALTDKGRMVLQATIPASRRNADRIAARLTEDERRLLATLLAKLTEAPGDRPSHL